MRAHGRERRIGASGVAARRREVGERRTTVEHINHGAQYARAFPKVRFGDLLTVDYVRYAAHTFTHLPDQERIETLVARWAADIRSASKRPSSAVA